MLLGESDDDRGIIRRFGLHEIAHLHDDQRVAFFLQHVERKGNVLRGQLRAVVKSSLGAHREPVGSVVRRNLDRFRREPVERIGLVARTGHERRKDEVHALRALALEDVGVEGVEGEERLIVGADRRDQGKRPALRRIDIHVLEMVEVGRIFQIAECRHAMGLGAAVVGARGAPPRQAQRAERQAQHAAAREEERLRRAAQERLPILAALSASHHHKFGNPEMPYLGSGSGWLKRSQRA